MSSIRISRRAALRGIGLSIGLPLLEGMVAPRRAQAQQAPGRPLVIFWWGHGAPMADFTPATPGTGFAVPEILRGLSEIDSGTNATPTRESFDATNKVAVLTGLSNMNVTDREPAFNRHPKCVMAALTGFTPSGPNAAVGPSIDRLAGRLLADPIARLPSLSVAVSTRRDPGEGRWSWDEQGGAAVPIEPLTDPRRIFQGLFSDAGGGDPSSTWAEQRARRTSVLDYVRGSIARLEPRLGCRDRARLDQHLTAIRELEQALPPPPVSCAAPAAPGDADSQPIRTEGSDVRGRSDLLLQLSVLGLSCGATRVLNFSLQPSADGSRNYGFTGNTSYTDHNVSHYQAEAAGARHLYLSSTRWKVSRFARLIQLLDQQPEAEGSLLDRSVVIGLSEMSEGGGHASDFLPVLVSGAGVRGGEHLVFPHPRPMHEVPAGWRAPGGTTELRSLWLTALRAAGAEVDQFGGVGEPLSGLWSAG